MELGRSRAEDRCFAGVAYIGVERYAHLVEELLRFAVLFDREDQPGDAAQVRARLAPAAWQEARSAAYNIDAFAW